ncbi:TPA: hypothetical protein DCQ44_01040, partial [Candidatus Taylorbacteria bacterium]|nr:hypothetical protein [Candidatus Taylorbacteria bacterium]
MSIDEAKLLIYMTEMFKRHGEDFDQIKSKFDTVYKDSPALRDRLPTYGHFYYFICAPGQAGVREELQIVGVTSLIDAMMGDCLLYTSDAADDLL